MQASMKLGEAMYKASQDSEGGEGDDSDAGGKAEEDVIDADFQEVDDEDKKKSA
jgi:molecular chaperone DnaK